MRYLRILSNSVIAGALACAYIAVLVLHLNPHFPLSWRAVTPLIGTLALAFGVNLTIAFYALIVARQLVATDVLSPGWLSVRVLSWLCTLAASGGAAIMWLNLRSFAPVLPPDTIRDLTAAAVMLTGSALVFLLIALAHLERRAAGLSALLLVVMVVLSIAAPVAARGWGDEAPLSAGPATPPVGSQNAPPAGRVVLIMLDGASLDVIAPAVAEGRLPNFGKMLDAGSVLHLATLRPTQAEPVWSAAATGRVPVANGVQASASYRVRGGDPPLALLPDYCFAHALVRFGFLTETPHDRTSLKSRPIWQILSDAGLSVGIIGWPLTHPAPSVNGFLVSDQFHVLNDARIAVEGGAAVWPPELLDDIRSALRGLPTPDPVALVSQTARAPEADPDTRQDPSPVVADRVHLQILRSVEPAEATRFLAVHFPGLDAIGHYYLRYADPTSFGDVSDDERRRFGPILHEYYRFIDSVVGSALTALRSDDLLLVVSGFGMEPLSPGKRVLERLAGNSDLSGTHERAPDGFLLAYGSAVAPGHPGRASVLDVTPTILYFLGLPVGRDMEGFVRTDLFKAGFTASRPLTFIPSYGQ